MKKLVCYILLSLCFSECLSQTLYNAKNIDRTAISYFDGSQVFRALEYTINADPQSEKVYRLQTMPENGYPGIEMQGLENNQIVYFEDKATYDNMYTDNQTQYLSAEAVQTFYSFQRVMSEINKRFGWKGPDGMGTMPIKIFLKNSDEYPGELPTFSEYIKGTGSENFAFFKSVADNTTFYNSIDIVAHEYAHSIFQNKTSIVASQEDLCGDYRAINEGIANIIGLYIKNRILQSPTYDWFFGEQLFGQSRPFNYPKSHGYADTYNGQYYVNVCDENYPPHPGAGVAEKWFYLLSEGFQGSAYNDLNYGYSSLTPIGVEKAIEIVWNAIPSVKVYSDYPAFMQFTLQTAEKLYGLHSTEYIAVQNAWCAVGVCDNNTPGFSMSPVNTANNIHPWPHLNVNITWQNNLIKEWEVQLSTSYDFSENIQTVIVDNFSTIVDQNGQLSNYAVFDGYYHPGEKIYARAKITKASQGFCKGINPLCAYYQQFGPAHHFTLDDLKVQFWPNSNASQVVNPWNKPLLRWKSISDAERYRIQIASDPAFADILSDEVVMHTGNFTETGEVNLILEPGKDYYARVRAERVDFVKINKNYGHWSDMVTLHAATPQTSIIQALNQTPNDPPKAVSSLGTWLSWHPYAGATNYVIQLAQDINFTNVLRSQTIAGNVSTIEFQLPQVQDQTELFIRVLPQRGAAFGFCNNVWRIKTDEHATIPVMKSPTNNTTFPFKSFLGTFVWNGGTLNLDLVDHFEVHCTEKTSTLTSIFATQGKVFDFLVQDPLLFDDKQGFTVSVRAVNALGAKSALSAPFQYTICPDHPGLIFPGDLGKVDPTKSFNIEWHPSFWFDPGSQFLVTILDGNNPIAGFNNKSTTDNFMLVPAGTLMNGKSYTVTVKNSSSCANLEAPKTFFTAVGQGGGNQPQPPQLVNFSINLNAFRNDPDASVFPPEWGTSNYVLGIELIDPDGNPLALVDPNGDQITQLEVDSQDSGVILVSSNKPQGKYRLRLKMKKIYDPLLYYPFDQPSFSVSLNGQTVVSKHVITIDLVNPASPFNEWQDGFQFADIVLDVK